MGRIEKLTPDQEAMMTTVRDEWINWTLTGGDDIDEKAAREGLEWLYQFAKLRKPITLIVDSPMAAQLAVPIAREMLKGIPDKKPGDQVGAQVRDQVGAQVRDQVWDQVGDQVWAQVRDQVWAQVWAQVRDQVWAQVGAQVRDQVGAQVRDQVWAQVGAQVRDQVGDQVWDQVWAQLKSPESFSWSTGTGDSYWGSWADFFDRMGIVNQPGLEEYMRFLKSGAFMGIYLDGLAIVCRRPQHIRRDSNNLLDSDQKPAIEWRDGYKLWFLHGTHFTEDVWQRVVSQELTLPELARMELGTEQRAVAIQMLRPDRLLEQMNAKLISTGQKYSKLLEKFGEDYCAANFPWSLNSPTRLYEVKNFMDTGETEYCMRMSHPSIKDKEYIEWVEPEVGVKADADLAQAHAFGMSVEEYFQAVEA